MTQLKLHLVRALGDRAVWKEVTLSPTLQEQGFAQGFCLFLTTC